MTFNYATDERCRFILSSIPEGGISVAQMAQIMGVERASAEQRLRTYMKQGLIHVARAKVAGATCSEAWYFTTVEDRDAFQERWVTAQTLRDRERNRQKYYARQERLGKVVTKREQTEAKKQQTRLKAETKAAGALVFKPGTEVARPKRPTFADLPAQNPNGVEPVKLLSSLRGRFETEQAPSVISSNDCREWARAVA
jgi:hypothetical protein